jgi:ribonuclease III
LQKLRDLLDEVPEDLARQVFTHASWTARRSDSYARLAFLGDSVLGLAITAHIYPLLEAERYGAGRLTKIRAQTVSGPSCRNVAERLGVPERLRAAVPEGAEQTNEPELEHALEHPVDYKSTLQERLAQRGEVVAYEVTAEHGPPHDRMFDVAAQVGSNTIGTGSGRSKKHAEQEAARVALEALEADDAA